MIVLPGPLAYSPFRVNALVNNINTAVNSSAVVGIRTVYVHYVAVREGSDLKTNAEKKELLSQLLDYETKPDAQDELNAALLAALDDETARLPDDSYLLRVIPRPGTISPWSSKATNIAHVCGFEKDVERIERGLALIIKVRKGFPLDEHLKSGVFLDFVYDRMTQSICSAAPTNEDLFAHHSPKPLVTVARDSIPQANKTLGLALDQPEIDYLAHAFPDRDPTDVELFMFAQVNSEHCRHKIFNADWTIDGENKPYSLFKMIRNTHQKHPEYTISAYSDNAAVLEGHEGVFWAPDPKTKEYKETKETVHFLAKVETHNHPTAVSPFPGAATGSGGEIRDEGAVGRGSKSKAGLSGFTTSDLLIPGHEQPWELNVGRPNHIASALDIMIEAPIGSAAFNNEFGRPALGGYFRTLTTKVPNAAGKPEIRGYHKPIMLAGGVGAIRPQFALKDRKITPGAALIVLGGPSMLIGLGGGAASSVSSGEGSADLDFASVQRGNPEMQRRAQCVIDACVALGTGNPIQSIHDVGAGGLSNALTELVHDNDLGARFELRDIPNVEPGMSPMEIWCCEAQERYVLGVAPSDLDTFKAICERERSIYGVVGYATSEQRLVLTDRLLNTTPIDIEMSVLFGKAPKMSRTDITSMPKIPAFETEGIDVNDALNRSLALPAVGSKSFLVTIGDRSITGLCARDQMVGPWQVPVADVAVTITSHGKGVNTGEAFAMGERPTIALISGAASAKMSVAESLLNLYASDVKALERVRLSANWMSAASHEGEGAILYEAVQAIGLDLCPELGVAIPVGKDSMSMKMKWEDKEVTAPMSVVITAFAPVEDVRRTWTPQLERVEGSKLVLVDLGLGKNRLGGSCVAQVFGQVGNDAPTVDDAKALRGLLKAMEQLHKQEEEVVMAYHDRSDGGLITTVLEMAFAGRVGVEVTLEGKDAIASLFSEELGAVFQVADVEKLASVLEAHGVPDEAVSVVGTVKPLADQTIDVVFNGKKIISEPRGNLQQAWAATSYRMQRLRDNPQCADQEYASILDNNDPGLDYKLAFDPNQSLVLASRPKVAILREQGVNSMAEMAYSFSAAGFTPVDVHMSDIISKRVTLDDFVGLAACGGFSYGDVLGAGQGWAKSVLFHAEVKQEFSRFFNDRADTFAVGMCNGCQFLSKLKSILPGCEDWPSFERNRSEQYEARTVMVEVCDDNNEQPSIFLQGMRGSRFPIPVAHGEGRAQFESEEQYHQFVQSKLTVVRYVDNYGNTTEKYPFNPNGSPGGITGIRSPNGRIMAIMPHPERSTIREGNSWYPKGAAFEEGPWIQLFKNARKWVG
ncbi:phosphoribosylformylglycinamidine synthase [Trichomonascus vanleenenianus]|uniref:phosphoribosylformylglycinamidine synthase n=1 Tax=Trichomonascus vanleenenianus TaxID=2268995 RepID=UPI003ECA4D5A